MSILDFEKSIVILESKIEDLKKINKTVKITQEIVKLESKLSALITSTYKKISPWQKVQVARHSKRPKLNDYVSYMMSDFENLCGDKLSEDDPSMLTGIAKIEGKSVAVIGQNSGKNTEERIKYNFGMTSPAGYRKAQKIMNLANKFNLPVISFIDTPGAYAGVDAENNGQSSAIAKSMELSFEIDVPIISVVIGQGFSGGAIAIGTSDRILMMENSVYSVISPEACASILWQRADAMDKLEKIAKIQNLTASDLLRLKIIDEIIKEPKGGAHRAKREAILNVKESILRNILHLSRSKNLKASRVEKFLAM